MKSLKILTIQTKIIIGLAVITVVSTGLFIRQLIKTGEARAQIKAKEERISDLMEYMDSLETQADTIEKELIKEKGNVARLTLREQIYLDKIKVDSLLLKEIKLSNERIDSLSADWNLDDWNKFITTDFEDDISEN